MGSQIPGASWPVAEGRYEVGKRDSPVAVCTMSSVDMTFPMDRIAIAGKCVTENLGVEKMVRNIVSNPGIRYLVMCGRESMGHFVDNAVESLIENGVDSEGRIIGARGGIPVLRNLSGEEIEGFRRQVTLINMAGETSVDRVMERVGQLLESGPAAAVNLRADGGEAPAGIPGRFPEAKDSLAAAWHPEAGAGPAALSHPEARDDLAAVHEEPERIAAPAHPPGDWVQDPSGYFTITVTPGREIVAEHHDNSGGVTRAITGRRAEDIYHRIILGNLVSRLDHAAYLGRELAKAEAALASGIDYEQDSPLEIPASGAGAPGGGEKSVTYLGAGVREFTFRETRSREEDEFRKFLLGVGLCRLF